MKKTDSGYDIVPDNAADELAHFPTCEAVNQ